MESDSLLDDETMLRISIERPGTDGERELVSLSHFISKEEINQTQAIIDPIRHSLLKMVDDILTKTGE